MKKILYIITILSLLLPATSAMALLDTSFELVQGNVGGIAGFPTPFATVRLYATGAQTLEVTFTASNPYAYDYYFGREGTVALNLVSGVTLVPSGILTPGLEEGKEGNEDGFGKFNFRLEPAKGFDSTNFPSVVFTLETTGSFNALGDVLTPNASGYIAAAHMVIIGEGINTTGYATNGDGTTLVPEPGTMILLGLGLLGLGITSRKRS